MSTVPVELAARDNAAWCALVVAGRGGGEEREGCWVAREPSPPGYPDAVTLTPDARVPADVLAGAGASVKDSFAALDLAPQGLRVLFDATWVGLAPAGAADAASSAVAADWSPIGPDAFAAWARIHGEADALSADLVRHPAVRLLRRGDSVAVISCSGGAVGLSNVALAPGVDQGDAWRALAATAWSVFGPLPLVGYEHGAELDGPLAAGFVALGPLRVWIADAPGVGLGG